MKKHFNLTGNTCIIAVLAILLGFSSCNKIDTPNAHILSNDEMQKKAQQMVDANPQLKNVKYNLNIKGTSYYADKEGNKIDPATINSYVYQCEEIDYAPTSTLETVTREWSCSQGYRFKVKWKISASLPILATNPFTGAATRGRLRIKNTSGSTLFYQSSVTPVTVTILGDDPNTGNINRLYALEYYTDWVPFSVFTMETAALEHQIFAQTDCIYVPQILNLAYSPPLESVLNPCNRIEEIGINPRELNGSGGYITNGTLLGYYQLVNPCPPPTGSTMPDRHEVQIKYVGTGSTDVWRAISPQNSYNTGNLLLDGYVTNPVTIPGTISVYDVYRIPNRDLYQGSIHGNYLVRYRNVKSGSPTCYGPWSQEFAIIF